MPERIENLQDAVDKWEERRAALRRAIEEEIARFKTMRPDVTLDVHSEVISGKPYREILKYVLQVGAKILVVGTHGHTGFKHTLLGSVAERVVRKAPCTVVVAKPSDVCEYLAVRLGGGVR